MCADTSAIKCLWRSEDNLEELVLSFHHVVPEDQTQVFKLGDRHLVLEPGGPFKRPGGWLI